MTQDTTAPSQDTAPSLGDMVKALTPEATDSATRYSGRISPSWMQGRTAFGGITAALALAATRKARPDLPKLRSMQVSFLRPISEEVTFEVTAIREGRSSSFFQVDAISDGKTGARCTFVFGADRDSAIVHDYGPAPALPDPVALPDLVRRSKAPSFFSNFQARVADGDPLISGSARPEVLVWSRLAVRDDIDPEIAFICNADSLPPAAMTTFTVPAPISTITWSLDMARCPADLDWTLTRTTSKQASDGYSVQDMEIRARDGSLLASAQQMVALFA